MDTLHVFSSVSSVPFFVSISDTDIPVRFFFLSAFTVTVHVMVDLSPDSEPVLLMDAVDLPALYHVLLSLSVCSSCESSDTSTPFLLCTFMLPMSSAISETITSYVISYCELASSFGRFPFITVSPFPMVPVAGVTYPFAVTSVYCPLLSLSLHVTFCTVLLASDPSFESSSFTRISSSVISPSLPYSELTITLYL